MFGHTPRTSFWQMRLRLPAQNPILSPYVLIMLRAGSPFHILLLSLALLLPALAAPINYEKEILPFLKDNCMACHNKTTTKAGLNMETPELMMKGGENGKGIEAGAGAKSLIYQAAAGDWDSEMPPKTNKVGASPLDEKELALLKQWIDEGAHHSGKQEKVIAWEPLPAAFAPIFAAGISPDGSHAAAARGNQVSIYHVPTGQLVTKLTDEALLKSGLYKKPGVAHRDIVPALLFTTDGQRLLTGSYREVKIWKRAPLVPHSDPAQKPAAAPVAKFSLVPAATPDSIALQDKATGKTLRELKHGAAISAFVLSQDEQRIATAGADHQIKLWETATGKLTHSLISDAEADRVLAEKTDALARATVETAWQNEMIKRAEKEMTDLTARLKKANELSELAKKSLEEKRKEQKTKSDAKAAAEKALKDLDDQIAKLPAGTKPDEALVKKQAEAKEKAEKAGSDAKTATEGLTRAENAVTDTAEEIKVVSASSTRATGAVKATQAAAAAAKKAQDEAAAARTVAEKARATVLPEIKALTFSPDGAQVAALDAKGLVRFSATRTGGSTTNFSIPAEFTATSLVWQEKGDFIGAGSQTSKAELMIPDPAKSTWKLERTLGTGDGKSPITDRVNALALSPDGQTLAVGSGEPSRSGDITLWSLTSGKMTGHYDERHIDTVLTLDFSPDGRHLASGGADKVVRVTELASGKMVKVFEGHTHHVLGVAWRADGRLLASAGADNVVKVWDWTTGDRRKSVDGWDKEVTALRYLGGSDTAATSAGDAQMRLINSDGGTVKALTGATGFMNTVSATRTGNLILAGGETGVLYLWDVATGKEIWKAE